jgi:hypothetical protein
MLAPHIKELRQLRPRTIRLFLSEYYRIYPDHEGADEVEVRLAVSGANGRNSRVVQLEAAAPVNNLKVIHFGRVDDLGGVPLKLKPWDIRWIEIE